MQNLQIPEAVLAELKRTREPVISFDWPSPVSGVVMQKKAIEGMMMKAGDEMLRLADLSSIWVIADVPEQDVGRIAIGDPVSITVRAFPGETFAGNVAFVLPELKAETRTAQVRIELPNPGHKLLHKMYADVTIETGAEASVLAIPESAIIDSGNRQVAIVEVGEGRYKPVSLKLGRRGGGQVEVLEGLAEGERIVTRANFLIDAESNLQSALTALVSGDGAAQ